jgi:hypothetical protein
MFTASLSFIERSSMHLSRLVALPKRGKTKRFFIALAAGLTLCSAAFAGDIQYTVNAHASLTRTIGHAVAAEDAIYLVVSITAKNLTPQQHFLTEFFGPTFKVKTGDFSFDLDTGAGWQGEVAAGSEPLDPLMNKHIKLAFTVPNELARNNWTLITPDGETFDVAAR